MKHAAVISGALALAGCVEGLAPAEIGVGRLVGTYPGQVATVLPPMTDQHGNLFVVTGMPDSTGMPQPGTAHTGGARGGWSAGCATGTGVRGGARGWIGAVNGAGWLWTQTAIVKLDVATGTCETMLDTDPVSTSDIVFLAAAPVVDWTVSGRFALAIVTTGAAPAPQLATLDLDLGLVRASQTLGDSTVLAVGGDAETSEAAFLVASTDRIQILIARAHTGIVATVPVTGTAAPRDLPGDLAFGNDGSIAAIVGDEAVAIGTRAGLAIVPAPFVVRTIERDEDGRLWLAGVQGSEPRIAPIEGGRLGAATSWTCASAVDKALAEGVIVIDERGGERAATRWQAHGAYGMSALLPARSVPAYALGARAVLVGDAPVDRGGIPYSQLAVVPVGVVLR